VNRQFRAKGRAPHRQHVAGTMNKTEQAYALVLEARKQAGEIAWYEFEKMTFKLAPLCSYTPDFVVMLADDGTLEMHEVKARTKAGKVIVTDDAAVKLRLFPEVFPVFGLVIASGYKGDFTLEIRA
jgi:hypothetical protein